MSGDNRGGGLQGRPQNEVHAGASDHTETDVDPEHDLHDVKEPYARMFDTVLANVDEDDCYSSRDE